jgi:hypothetical protein
MLCLHCQLLCKKALFLKAACSTAHDGCKDSFIFQFFFFLEEGINCEELMQSVQPSCDSSLHDALSTAASSRGFCAATKRTTASATQLLSTTKTPSPPKASMPKWKPRHTPLMRTPAGYSAQQIAGSSPAAQPASARVAACTSQQATMDLVLSAMNIGIDDTPVDHCEYHCEQQQQ